MKNWFALTLVMLWVTGCASEEPTKAPGRNPEAFEAPAPLKPEGIDTTPEVVKAPWKKAPVSVTGANRELGTEFAKAQTAELDAKKQADDAKADAARRGKVRRGKRREQAGKIARRSRLDLDALVKQGTDALEEQARAQDAGAALQIRVARAEALLETSGANSSQLLIALRRQVVSTGARAREAERKAKKARRLALTTRRFLQTTLKEGLVVPAARSDARKTELKAQRKELTALRLRWLNTCAQRAHQQALKESFE